MFVYYADSHGRGSRFYPDRVLEPSVVTETVKMMNARSSYSLRDGCDRRFASLVMLVEAPYADWSFYGLGSEKNVLVLTLKDVQQSGAFTHIRSKAHGTNTLFSGVWDGTWMSLLLYACDTPLVELARMGHSAGLLMQNRFAPCGLWGDRALAKQSFQHVFGVERGR